MPIYPSDMDTAMDTALLCGPYVLGDLQEQPDNLHAPPSTSDCGSLTMPISPSEYDDAAAGESKDERKSALAAPSLSEEVYTFDPHQCGTFPNSGPSRRPPQGFVEFHV